MAQGTDAVDRTSGFSLLSSARRRPSGTACSDGTPGTCAGARDYRVALLACVLVAFVAGGCGPSRLRILPDETSFNEYVLKAAQPVVVQFSKGGCVWCMFMDAGLDKLVDEYQGRVLFARFELIDAWHRVRCDRLWRRYRVAYYPTVILFINGKEKNRWVVDYNVDHYRTVLEEVVEPPPPPPPPPKTAPPGR